MWRRALSIGLLLACMVRAESAAAEAALRVELRVESESDARLLERTRGQTSDLPIALTAYAPSAALGGFGAAVAQAFARCKESGADVVVWRAPGKPDGEAALIVALATCKDGRVFARRIESVRPARGASEGAQSGALETAALLLRGALSVLAQGGTLGVVPASEPEPVSAARAEDAAAQAPASERRTSAPAVAPDARAAAVSASRAPRQSAPSSAETNAAAAATGASARSTASALQGTSSPAETAGAEPRMRAEGPAPAQRPAPSLALLALAGLQEAWDGASAKGQPALHAALALGKGSFRLGVTGSFGFEVEHPDPPYAELVLSRHSVAAQWRQRLWRRPEWSVSTGLDAGALFYLRETRALASSTRSRPRSLSPAGFASPWISLGRRLGPLWISLAAGLDLLPFVPSFVYRTPAGTRAAIELWPVAPKLLLAFGMGQP